MSNNKTNLTPPQMVISSASGGYDKVYVSHPVSNDTDTTGKKFKIVGHADVVSADPVTGFTILDGLTPDGNNQIQLSGAWFDAMMDTDLLNADFGLAYSTLRTIDMLQTPQILDITVVAPDPETGGAPGYAQITIDNNGTTNSYEIELRDTSGVTWVTYYIGYSATGVVNVNPPEGTYEARIRGRADFPDGTVETSPYDTYGSTFTIDFVYTAPNIASIDGFTWKQINDGSQRFDLKVHWLFDETGGAAIRNFNILYRATSSGITWEQASVTTAGAGTRTVLLPNFPTNVEHEFRIDAVAWGPEDESTSSSSTQNYTLDPSDTTDRDENLDIGAYIEYRKDAMVGWSDVPTLGKRETFKVGSDGSVRIGVVGQPGIDVDAASAVVNIDGGVISQTITAANFRMAFFDQNTKPSISTTTKPSYGTGTNGIWMGFTDASTFKFDVGSPTEFIRWDGSSLVIAGDVKISTGGTIGGGAVENQPNAGYYAQGMPANFYGIFDETAAEQYFSQYFPTPPGYIPKWAVLTQFRSTDPTNDAWRITKMYNGTDWVSPSLFVTGDIISDNTIRGAKIIGSSIEGDKINALTTITVGSGNNVVKLSGSDASWRIAAGHATMGSAPFRVSKDGALTATNATLTGGLTISNNIVSSSGALKIGSNGIIESGGYSGNRNFYVHGDGELEIGNGGSSGTGAGYHNAPFRVTAAGELHATNAVIQGTIIADEVYGKIYKSSILPTIPVTNQGTSNLVLAQCKVEKAPTEQLITMSPLLMHFFSEGYIGTGSKIWDLTWEVYDLQSNQVLWTRATVLGVTGSYPSGFYRLDTVGSSGDIAFSIDSGSLGSFRYFGVRVRNNLIADRTNVGYQEEYTVSAGQNSDSITAYP